MEDDMGRQRYRCGSSTTRSLLFDLPPLARVERARLKYEPDGLRENGIFREQRTSLSSNYPSLMSSEDPSSKVHVLKKGLLWQQRDRLFSRWKERYFILTKDYLHCFKRSSSNEKISRMGQFIFKVKLVEVDRIEWVNKKNYSTVSLVLQDCDHRLWLRTDDDLEDWYELLDECTMTSKERRKALREFGRSSSSCLPDMPTCDGGDNSNEISNIDKWLLSRMNPAVALDQSSLSDSVPDLYHNDYQRCRVKHLWQKKFCTPHQQRFSLLTDIDANNSGSSVGTPSIQSTMRNKSYQFNNDIFCLPSGSKDEYYSSTYNQNKHGASTTNAFDSLRSQDNVRLAVERFKEERFNSAPPSPPTPSVMKYPGEKRGQSRQDVYNYLYAYRPAKYASNPCSYVSQQPTIV